MRFLGLSLRGASSGCQDDLAFSRTADPRWRDREAVRPLRSGRPRGRLYCHVGSDRGREPHRRAEQRNTDAEKADIKAGRIPQDWSRTRRGSVRKTRDARWTVKFSKAKPRADGTTPVDIAIPTFGYQNHISTDRRHGLIREWAVTDAAAYEGRMLRHGLLDGPIPVRRVGRHGLSLEEERGVPGAERLYQSRPSQEARRPADAHADPPRQWPQICLRSRIEHVFAEQKDRMSLFVRTIGITRARIKIGLANLVYNIKRLIWLERTAAI